jgi:hypothetical protein
MFHPVTTNLRRGASVSVSPAATTTYTLAATNAFGRTTATVTITVQ